MGSPGSSPSGIVAHSRVPGQARIVFPSGLTLSKMDFPPEVTVNQSENRARRWTVIASGLLCGALAMVVLFTNRGAFFSPLAVVVMGAVGLAAVLLQLRVRNRGQVDSSRSPALLNILGIVFALSAF